MKETILLVMWMIGDHPPIAYQVPFNSMAACMVARAALIDDAHRMERGGSPEGGTLGGPGKTVIPLPPINRPLQLSVVCAEK
jgi:hypothetical protein